MMTIFMGLMFPAQKWWRLLVILPVFLLNVGFISDAATVQLPAGDRGSATAKRHLEDMVNSVDMFLGSSAIKDKLAELTQSSGSERQQIIILKKSDIADDIPEGELHNTSIVRKIGDITLVVNTTIDKMEDGDGVMIVFQTEVKPPPHKKVCKTDANCAKQHFCHREIFLGFDLSYCTACSKDGDRCHADSHCCDNRLCRWGRCREGATSGQVGTICSKDSDCGDNECCASVEGIAEPVCRPLATEGQHCCGKEEKTKEENNSSALSLFGKLIGRRSVPHQLPHECPCVKGLKCVTYRQTIVSVFDLQDAQSGGVCLPAWAEPDRLVAPALDEISKLQARQIDKVIRTDKDEE